MSLGSELSELTNNIRAAYQEIADKGGTVPTNKNTSNLANGVKSIVSGEVVVEIEENYKNTYSTESSITISSSGTENSTPSVRTIFPQYAETTPWVWNSQSLTANLSVTLNGVSNTLTCPFRYFNTYGSGIPHTFNGATGESSWRIWCETPDFSASNLEEPVAMSVNDLYGYQALTEDVPGKKYVLKNLPAGALGLQVAMPSRKLAIGAPPTYGGMGLAVSPYKDINGLGNDMTTINNQGTGYNIPSYMFQNGEMVYCDHPRQLSVLFCQDNTNFFLWINDTADADAILTQLRGIDGAGWWNYWFSGQTSDTGESWIKNPNGTFYTFDWSNDFTIVPGTNTLTLPTEVTSSGSYIEFKWAIGTENITSWQNQGWLTVNNQGDGTTDKYYAFGPNGSTSLPRTIDVW